MSGRVEMSTPLQDKTPDLTGSSGMKVALIGPNEMHRKIVAKALSGSEARSVREFVDYPTDLADLPRILDQNYDVIMIDVDSDQGYALKLVETIASVTNAMVMVYSKRNDPDLLMNCMRAGARDFLPLPEFEEPAPAAGSAPAPPHGPQLVPQDVRPVPSGPPRSFEAQVRPAEPAAPAPPAAPVAPRPVGEQSWPAEPTAYAPPMAAPEPRADDFSSRASLAEMRQLHSLQQDIDEWDQAHLRAPQPTPVNSHAPIPQPVVPPLPEIVRPPETKPQSIIPTAPPVIDIEPESQAAASEASKSLTSFDDWDSAFLRKGQSGSLHGPGVSARTPIVAPSPAAPVPTPPAAPSYASIRTPEEVSRLVAPADVLVKVEPAQEEAPADTSVFSQTRPTIDRASLPVFHYEVPEEEKLPKKNPMILVGVAVGIAAVAGVAAVVFLHPFQHSASPTQQVQPTAQQQQPTPVPPAWQPVTAVNQSSPSPAKPSAATPVAGASGLSANVGSANVPQVSSDQMDAQLAAPSRISKDVKAPAPVEEAPPAGFAPVAMDSGGSAPSTVFGDTSKVEIVPGVHSISSGVAEGMLIRKVAPVYPKFAKESRISGTVVMRATINKLGEIEGLKVMSGPKILNEAALNAVKAWRYRPYMLNNQPVEVQTTIDVVFNLNN